MSTQGIADLLTLTDRLGMIEGFHFWRRLYAARKSRASLHTLPLPAPLGSITIRGGSTDWHVVRQIFVQRHYVFPDIKLSPALVLDCGANLGASSLYFHSQFPEAVICAVEPDQSNFDLLTENTEKIDRIRCIHGAVWGDDAALEIADPDAPPSEKSVCRARDSASRLLGYSVNTLLKQSGFDRIGLLKLDVQGSEREIFSTGRREWLDRTDVIMIELHDFIWPGCGSSFYDALHGRRFLQFQNAHTILIDLRPAQ